MPVYEDYREHHELIETFGAHFVTNLKFSVASLHCLITALDIA